MYRHRPPDWGILGVIIHIQEPVDKIPADGILFKTANAYYKRLYRAREYSLGII